MPTQADGTRAPGPYHERSFYNPGWADSRARFLIVRLSPFRDVERSAPHGFLYREMRAAMPDAYIDFSFFPASRDRSREAVDGVPTMRGVASARPAADFDAIFISNAYTLELVNLVPSLAGSGIPATRKSRELAEAAPGGKVRYPLIVLGGSNAMASASVYDEPSGDSIVDAVYFGEGEGAVGALAVAIAGLPAASRRDAMPGIGSEVAGFWACASRGPVSQAKAIQDGYPLAPPPVFAGEEAGTVRLEITRGCPSFCTFCFEGWERKPYRETPIEAVLAEARSLKARTGASTVELASYNFNAHSRIVDIIKGLHGLFDVVNFQSQRVDILARSPALVRFEIAAGKRSFTVGVEGISARARSYFNKELSEADLRAVLGRIIGEGAREIKLFYILSGFEDGQDITEFSAFTGWLRAAVAERPAGSRPRVMVSAGELIRMPFTPLSYEGLILDPIPYRAIAARLKEITGHDGFEYRSPESFDEYCLSQVLALSPPGSMALLLAMAGHGYVYDRSLSKGAWIFAKGWLDARDALGATFIGEKSRDYPFAYPFVRPIASKDVTWERFRDARAARERHSCLGASCAGCGACSDGERAFLEAHAIDTVSESDMHDIEAIVAAKRRPQELYIRAALSRASAQAHPAYAAAQFLCGLYAVVPSIVSVVWRAEDAFLASSEGLERLPGAWGDTCYRLLSSKPLDVATLETAGYVVVEQAPAPERVQIRIYLPGTGLSDAVRLVSDFMTAAAMPFTLLKTAGETRFAISGKGLRKRNVLEAAVVAECVAEVPTESPGGYSIALACGPKYDLGDLATLAAKRRIALDLHVALY
ncbi:MAG: hypothetical protein CVV51_08770 [Spirochaetae bacterium HGW-Spirochaetae-7]|nr:MAG: hypothetical protein CVV51_08770 [Spirochaetae bacterium HGW-Spirochaetae-7]